MAALESAVVALIVAVCILCSTWQLLSARLRLRALEAVLAPLGSLAPGFLIRLRQRTLARMSAGCGACPAAGDKVNAAFRPSNRTPAAPRR
ncbi:MAG TPA: hypothetical protein VLX90_04065 [Steroidobacteraceae bacterium]|nr:hypothetical protein [Steroidobacteraceae bacterium]